MLLECAVAAVFIETVTSALAAQAGPALRGWYRTFGMGAVAMDLLSLCVGVYAGLKLASVFGFEDSIASKVFCAFLCKWFRASYLGAALPTFLNQESWMHSERIRRKRGFAYSWMMLSWCRPRQSLLH